MSSLNPTDFPGNAFATAKALRQSALKWQFRSSSKQLREDATRFVRIADQRAHFRLSSLLPVLFAQDSDDPLVEDKNKEDKHLAPDADQLSVASGARCYRAESEQHGTFALQINSICDLALEMAMAAAADHAPAKPDSE